MNSYLRWGIVIGLLLTLFLPLVVSSSLYFPFITGKNFAFRIIAEVVFALWIILALRDANYRPKKTWLLGLLTAFLVVVALATAYAIDPLRAFWSNQERMEGLISFLHLFAYFVVLTSILKTERAWWWFWHTSIGVSIIVGFYGLEQLAGWAEIHQGGARLDASLGNASYLAVYMLVHLFLTAIYFYRTRTRARYFFYLPVIVLQFINLYYTATRGALLGFLGGILLATILLVIFERQDKRVRKWASGVLGAVIIFVALFMAFRNYDFIKTNPVLGRFSEISFAEGATNARLLIWGMSWRGFVEHPLLGWGPDNYMFLFNKYYDPGMYAQEQWFDRSHNVFLDWLVSAGVLGLGLYLLLFALAIYFLWWKITDWSRLEKSLFTGLLAGYFFHNIFVFDQLISYLSFFSILAYLNWRAGSLQPSIFREVKLPALTASVLGWLVVIGLIASLFAVNIKPIRVSSDLIKALSSGPNPDTSYLHSLDLFKKIFAARTLVSSEAREQLVNVAITVAGSDKYDDNFKKEILTLAASELSEQIKRVPADARARVFLGDLLGATGNLEPAVTVLKQAVAASPQKQTIMFQLGQAYLRANRGEEALATFKKAFELEPRFIEARKLYALTLWLTGETKAADELLLEGFGTVIINDSNFINAYAGSKHYDRVAKIWELRVKAEPSNAQNYGSLAGAYVLNGERAKAIEVLNELAKQHPELQTEVNHHISEIRAGRNP